MENLEKSSRKDLDSKESGIDVIQRGFDADYGYMMNIYNDEYAQSLKPALNAAIDMINGLDENKVVNYSLDDYKEKVQTPIYNFYKTYNDTNRARKKFAESFNRMSHLLTISPQLQASPRNMRIFKNLQELFNDINTAVEEAWNLNSKVEKMLYSRQSESYGIVEGTFRWVVRDIGLPVLSWVVHPDSFLGRNAIALARISEEVVSEGIGRGGNPEIIKRGKRIAGKIVGKAYKK